MALICLGRIAVEILTRLKRLAHGTISDKQGAVNRLLPNRGQPTATAECGWSCMPLMFAEEHGG